MVTGAESVVSALVDRGVEICFTNPGTSEMHFVAALDSVPSRKGGPYSHGDDNNKPGKGIKDKRQYGIFDVSYNVTQGVAQGKPRVTWTGFRADKNCGGTAQQIVSFQFRP